MKKFSISLFLVLFVACISFGQVTSKGNFLIGGTLGFSTANSSVEQVTNGSSFDGEGSRSTQFNIAPNIGYFVTNNFAVGLGLDYTLNKIEEPVDFSDPDTDFLESSDSDLLFGPFARYYAPIGGNKFFFVEATFGFGSSQDEFQTAGGQQTTSTNVFALGVGPGFSIVSNDAIGIEALVKYNYARANSEIEIGELSSELTTMTNQFDFSVGLQFYFSRLRQANN